MAVSLLRPWGDGGTPARTAVAPDATARAVTGRDASAVTPDGSTAQPDRQAAIPAPSLADDEIVCSPAEWRLVSLDHLGSWTVRSWTPAVAVLATGPLDPAIRPLTPASSGVLAIGACSPAVFDASGGLVSGGPARIVRAWRIDGGRATVVALDARRDETAPGVATLYRPGATSETDPWPKGEFVIEVAATGATDTAGPPGPRDPRLTPDRRGSPAWYIGLAVGGSG